ncbi:MAG: hypothetical protein SGBAC_002728 [Bacillariaceae sp.]
MNIKNSQTSSKPESSMKSLSQQVLRWQKDLAAWNGESNNSDSKDSRNATQGEVPNILQDANLQNTLHTLVQVLTSSLPKASEPDKTLKDSTLVNASLEVLTKAATQPTAKTMFVSSGAIQPISDLLRKACLSHKFGVSPANAATATAPLQNSFGVSSDEKKDDDGSTTTTTNTTISTATDNSVASSSSEESRKTPAMALHCLANLADNASDLIKNDYLLPIANPLIHNIMDQCLHEQAIQRYSCKMLYHLSNPLLQELVAAGFVEVIWKANQAHPDDAILQHYANACLYNLLPVCPEPVLRQTVKPQQMVQGLVPGMTSNPEALEVQKYALLVMTRVATNNTSQNHPAGETSPNTSPTNNNASSSFSLSRLSSAKNVNKPKENALQASHALGLPHVIYCILTALNLHCKNDEVAQVGCNLLKYVSRISIDFANAMIDRGGLSVLLRIMQCHLDHTSIQDPVMATLRNLLSLRTTTAVGIVDTTSPQDAAKSIRLALQADATGIYYNNANNNNNNNNTNGGGGDSTLVAMIRAIGLVMSIHVPDAPIQAYGCDAFGRLAALDDYANSNNNNNGDNDDDDDNSGKTQWIRQLLFEGNALRLALQAMRVHSNHIGVQDRAIVLLLRLCSYEQAYDFLRQEKEMEEESDEEAEEDFEYGDEYEDDSIGPVLQESATGDSNFSSSESAEPQSFVYKILANTKVSPKKESQDRLQRLRSIVDLQGLTPATTKDHHDSSRTNTTRREGSGLFSRLSIEGASGRIRNLRESFSSPTATANATPTTTSTTTSATANTGQRTSRWWKSSPAK